MNSIDHNRIIATAARSVLAPLGCRQQGRSRTWLDDHGWWVAVVEFRPSRWSKGSGLSVGACWLWHEQDHLSFDYSIAVHGSKTSPFQEFDGTRRFEAVATSLAQSARLQVIELRHRLQSVADASAVLEAELDSLSPIWSDYHAGVAAGLIGNVAHAAAHFRKIEKARHDVSWVHELKGRTAELARLLSDREQFRREIESVIARTRERLELPKLAGSAMAEV
ncbi:MAG TPA: hypothetical protein VH814_26045 [Steroidobacteraceae bacterium]|jgi:hypothetical protein